MESFSTQYMTSFLFIWSPTVGEHGRQDSGLKGPSFWYTLHAIRERRAKQLSGGETVPFLAVIHSHCQGAVLLSAAAHPCLQTRHQVTVQHTYTWLSLVAAAPFLLSACLSDPVATVVQVGWWGEVRSAGKPTHPNHTTSYTSSLWPCPHENTIWHILPYSSASSCMTAAQRAWKWWDWELQR